MKLTGRKKKSKSRLVIEIIVLVIIAYNIILRAIPVSFGVISNDDDANDAVVRGALRYSNSFSIKTENDPYLDYQWILDASWRRTCMPAVSSMHSVIPQETREIIAT